MDLWVWFNQVLGAAVYYALVLLIVVPLTLRWRSPYVAASLYIASYVIAQYTSPRLTTFMWWVVPGGNIPFVATVALMDIIVVYWGLTIARQVIIAGFLAQILLYAANIITVHTPPGIPGVESLDPVYSVAGRVAVASPIAYLIAEMVNAQLTWVYRRIWWARTVYSDPIALTVDTLIFIPIAFYGEVPTDTLTDMILGLTALKITLIPLNLLAIYASRKTLEEQLTKSR
ncbi:MAG: queuosine precursor transporter [Thermoprotei archaeon]|nr:queuosine precursor transporter [Thermoprotei archaeon]